MRCPKCNALIADDINFCNYCGENLHKENTTNNVVNNQPTTTVDEDYLKAYIGNNYDTISNKSFNIFAFLFAQYYCLYRKQYKLFGILILVSIVSIFFGGLSVFVDIGVKIYFGIKFNELYLKEAEKDIKLIEATNQNKTKEEIIELCKKKGGTTMLYTGLLIGAQAVLFFIIIVLTILFITVVGDTYSPDDFNINDTFNTNQYDFYNNDI